MKTEPSERIRPYAATKKAPPLPPRYLLCACPAASRCLYILSRKHNITSLGLDNSPAAAMAWWDVGLVRTTAAARRA